VVLICYEDANDAVMNKFISYRQGQATHTDTATVMHSTFVDGDLVAVGCNGDTQRYEIVICGRKANRTKTYGLL